MLFVNEAQRRNVLAKVLAAVDQKFMGAEPNTRTMREEHEAQILGADTADDFEQAMNSMLKKLGTSHTGFFHEGRPRAAGRIAIAATLTKAETRGRNAVDVPGRALRWRRRAGWNSIWRRTAQGR